MKKALKIVAAVILALTLSLGMNVTNASAQADKACYKTYPPICTAVIAQGQCTSTEYEGYPLASVEITNIRDPFPAQAKYLIDACGISEKGVLDPLATKRFPCYPPSTAPGIVCNVTDPLDLVQLGVTTYYAPKN